jgi:hypothetical protein
VERTTHVSLRQIGVRGARLRQHIRKFGDHCVDPRLQLTLSRQMCLYDFL